MKNKLFPLTILILALTCSPALADHAPVWTGNVNLSFGNKMLDHEDWKPVDDLLEFGVQVDFKKVSWPVSIAIDTFYAWDEETGYFSLPSDSTKNFLGKFKMNTVEVHAGVRKLIENWHSFIPYVNGGLALGYLDYSANTTAFGNHSEDSFGAGVWLGLGAYYRFSETVNLGLDGRWSWVSASVDYKDISGTAGGFHLSAIVGLHW